MPCKIYLRHDQNSSQRETSKSKEVCVYAPSWLEEGIQILGRKLKGIEFTVLGREERRSVKRNRNSNESKVPEQVLERFVISEDFDNGNLIMLQKIARNEARNINGRVNVSLYQPDISDVNLIYSIKDLARQTVIVGKDRTVSCGGYKSTKVKQDEPVYIVDLAALQFQQPYNSGRLVLIQENDKFKGPLDDFIFENVVGEKKKSYKEVVQLISQNKEDSSTRYIKHNGFGNSSCFMDSLAYKRFVKHDVILSVLALTDLAHDKGDKLNFKFLKYGTGYFAGKFRSILNSLILSGVLDGIEELFEKNGSKIQETIKCLTFPFYDADPESKARLDELVKKYKIEYVFHREDALKQTMKGRGVLSATTNCADSNVACGNAMGFKSTDGAIAESLVSKGNIFCPNLNNEMTYKYLDVLD